MYAASNPITYQDSDGRRVDHLIRSLALEGGVTNAGAVGVANADLLCRG